ncbi:MAG: NAD(P)H-dependent oxidoreductase [Rhodospirillales bacterium]
MKTLLVMDTSPRRDAVSRQLTSRFIEQVSARFPDVRIIHRDIGATPPVQIDDELIDALRREPETLSDRQQAARAASDQMISEMSDADAIVIGAPMHNFTISAALRTWIDHVARPGKTFGYDPDTGPKGLLDDKPVYVLSTRGGKYGDGSPENPNPADFQSDYLRHILGFMGLKDVRIIAANGMDMGPEPRAEGMAEANTKIDAAVTDMAA